MKEESAGFSSLEILIAFTILTLTMAAVIMVVFGNQSVASDIQTNTEALYKAKDLLEQARTDSQSDFNLVNPKTITEMSGPLRYTKKLEVRQVDLFTKEITSVISWLADHDRSLSIALTTLLTNPEAVSGGDTCSSVLVGDWKNPQIVSYEFGKDILHDTSSAFPITSIQAYAHKLYVTVNNIHGNNDGTFFILESADPSHQPNLIDRFDNNPAVGAGLNAVAVDGHYAYVANAYGSNFNTCVQGASCSQLQVIDISTSPPTLAAMYKIPGVTGTAGQAIGTSIFYKHGIVYLGLAKATGPEFNVIDVGGGGTVGATPAHPVLLGSVEIGSGVNAIQVKGNYAYVASPDNEELKIFDVRVPSNPHWVGGFDAPGGGGNNGNGKSIYIVGATLYLGRTLLSGDELYLLNTADPETILPVLGSQDIKNGTNNASINGLIVRDHLAFLVTKEQFQIWKIDDPLTIGQYANPLALPPGSGNVKGTAIDCEGNYLFVGSLDSTDKGFISIITGGP